MWAWQVPDKVHRPGVLFKNSVLLLASHPESNEHLKGSKWHIGYHINHIIMINTCYVLAVSVFYPQYKGCFCQRAGEKKLFGNSCSCHSSATAARQDSWYNFRSFKNCNFIPICSFRSSLTFCSMCAQRQCASFFDWASHPVSTILSYLKLPWKCAPGLLWIILL